MDTALLKRTHLFHTVPNLAVLMACVSADGCPQDGFDRDQLSEWGRIFEWGWLGTELIILPSYCDR